jgi:hypothetical protein
LFLTGNSDVNDLVGGLKRLCQVFEHIEKLLILAASINRKLIDAPRLAQAIFYDYYNFYLPKMGTSLESICYEKVNPMFFTLSCYTSNHLQEQKLMELKCQYLI